MAQLGLPLCFDLLQRFVGQTAPRRLARLVLNHLGARVCILLRLLLFGLGVAAAQIRRPAEEFAEARLIFRLLLLSVRTCFLLLNDEAGLALAFNFDIILTLGHAARVLSLDQKHLLHVWLVLRGSILDLFNL